LFAQCPQILAVAQRRGETGLPGDWGEGLRIEIGRSTQSRGQ